MASYIIAAVAAVVLAVLTLYGFQESAITTDLSVFIETKPEVIYSFVSNPHFWIKFHHTHSGVEIRRTGALADGVTRYDYVLSTNVLHVGNHNVDVTMKADPLKHKVSINVTVLSGIAKGYVDYSLEGKESGTELREDGLIFVPKILFSFANRTTQEKHTEILDNIKLLSENPSLMHSEDSETG